MIFKPINSEAAQLLKADERKYQLQQQLIHSRAATLALFEEIDSETFSRQAHPGFSPVGWHLGHIGYTEALWLLEHSAGMPLLFPHYRRLFAADGLPKAKRSSLPSLDEICSYLEAIRAQVLVYLEKAPLDQQEWLWHWLIQHESQHCETIVWMLQLQRSSPCWMGPPNSVQFAQFEDNRPGTNESEMVRVEAGYFQQGSDNLDALDNEKPVHWVYLDSYWIDRYPVTRRQYRTFIEAGGYNDSRWWSPEGWLWLQDHPVSQPLYWHTTVADDHPVCGVSWYEADAFARFVGKRLPTEAEWEKAASWNPMTLTQQSYPWGEGELTGQRCNHNYQVGQSTPVHQYSQGQSANGCYDMLGNVWEWTATWFHPYDGFVSYPYKGYSMAYFDHQHRVLKGGSWATRSPVLRCAFRNWYHPGTREHFAGFRCACDAV